MDLPQNWPEDSSPVEIAPGLYTPRDAQINTGPLRDMGLDGYGLWIRATLDDRLQYAPTFVGVESHWGGPINGTILRRVPVALLLAVETRGLPMLKLPEHGWWPFEYVESSSPERRGPLLAADDLLNVARIYAYQHAIGGKPAHEVARILDIPRSTADYWIRRAKDKGLIYAEA